MQEWSFLSKYCCVELVGKLDVCKGGENALLELCKFPKSLDSFVP